MYICTLKDFDDETNRLAFPAFMYDSLDIILYAR